eukprot:3396107-Rhodomonas_salina.1
MSRVATSMNVHSELEPRRLDVAGDSRAVHCTKPSVLALFVGRSKTTVKLAPLGSNMAENSLGPSRRVMVA